MSLRRRLAATSLVIGAVISLGVAPADAGPVGACLPNWTYRLYYNTAGQALSGIYECDYERDDGTGVTRIVNTSSSVVFSLLSPSNAYWGTFRDAQVSPQVAVFRATVRKVYGPAWLQTPATIEPHTFLMLQRPHDEITIGRGLTEQAIWATESAAISQVDSRLGTAAKNALIGHSKTRAALVRCASTGYDAADLAQSDQLSADEAFHRSWDLGSSVSECGEALEDLELSNPRDSALLRDGLTQSERDPAWRTWMRTLFTRVIEHPRLHVG